MKVHEIATELRLNNKAILEKAKELGIAAKNMRDELSDEDATSIRSAFGKGNAGKSKAAPVKAKPAPGKKVPAKVVKDAVEEEVSKPKSAPKPAPKRITKEQLAAEERKKADPNAEDVETEDAAPKVAPKKQALKVAYTDKEEPVAKKPKENPVEKPKPAPAKEKVAEIPASAGTTEAATESKPITPKTPKPVIASEARQSSDSEKKPEKPAKDTKPSQEKKQTEKPKKKHAPAESKATDKKPDRGGRSADKNKKPARSGDKRRGTPDDFKGAKRSPILEDASLEKRPTKNKHRSRVVDKSEPDETQIIIEELEEIGTVILSVPITVAGFAEQTGASITDVIMALMTMGIMANVNQNLDETVTQLLADELGISIYIAEDEGEIVESGLVLEDDKEEDLLPRAPIVTVMGHVDHGKTSLLDAIRSTNVTKGEAGGITQHIGASEVSINGQKIVFLDTPGHEAFTAMRARGAHATDIAVLVVAADDGVMPQTLESISHAKAAGVPIIVAINKIDKEGANPDRVKTELSEQNILVEDWGGDTISVPVSAKSGEGITSLLEMILLQSEVLELKANPDRLATGTVIEARLDKAKGAVATLLVMNGTLETGDSIVVGVTSGRIRAMTDFSGKTIKKAGPATAVEVTGLSEVPWAGDTFNAVKDDKLARDIAESRKLRQRDEVMLKNSGASLDTLFSEIRANELKELNIIVKGDVQGSVGALTAQLEKLSNDDVKIRIVHRGVGAITESDVMLAATSNAVIIGFNVRPGAAVASTAEKDGVEIRTYRVIYEAIGDVEAAMKGMLDPEFREKVLGECEVRETFKVPGGNVIAGSYVTNGQIKRSAEVRIVRDGIVIHEGKISSLRRFKDDVREVATGYECGIGIDGYNDIKVGDVIEAFEMEEIER